MRKRIMMRAAAVAAILILLVLMIYGGLQLMESAFFSEEEPEVRTKTIVRDGVEYFPRQDLCVVMLLGVDQEGKMVPSEEPNHGNAVDMITLVVFDETDNSVSLLCLNRDTMVEMPRLNEHGRVTGTRVAQLALSHTYGRGMEDSCNNTKTTVSQLLYGTVIDYYFAMNMDAVSILNDAVGGVTVTVEDDFSNVDPTIQMGQMTLWGDQARVFVQSRSGVGNQLNLSRIRRQQEYMKQFLPALRASAQRSSTFVMRTYEAVSEYVVTDMTASVVSRLMEDYSDFQLKDVILLEGENVLAEGHYEFYVDETALEEIVLERLFAEKK